LSREKIAGFFHEEHEQKVLMDLKGLFDKKAYSDGEFLYWRL